MSQKYPDFQYHFFEPLDVPTVAEHYKSHRHTLELKTAFADWFKSYAHRARLFYKVQRLNHSELVWGRFRRQYGLGEEDSTSEYNLDATWDEWERESGLAKHCRLCAEATEKLNVLESAYRRSAPDIFASLESTEFILSEIQKNVRGEGVIYALSGDMDALWFNTRVANRDPQYAIELDRMPYKQFLQTPYWRRLRAGMLLIQGARCQNNYCVSSNEGSWRDEGRIHVHHLDYKHRGAEAYDEIILLCEQCHRAIHSGNGEIYVDGIIRRVEAG